MNSVRHHAQQQRAGIPPRERQLRLFRNPFIEAQRVSWRIAQGKAEPGDTKLVCAMLREGLR